LRTVLNLKLRGRTLFFKLLSAFLLVIVLLLSFNYFSLVFFRDNIRNEIIKYNNQNLLNTRDDFEEHFQLVSSLLLSELIHKETRFADRTHVNYAAANEMIEKLSSIAGNPFLFLDNLLVYQPDSDFILEKTRGADAKTYFSEYMHHDRYSYAFWMKEFDQSFGVRIYPAAKFENVSFGQSSGHTPLVLPMLVQSKVYPSVKLIALLDAGKLMHAYSNAINENFMILDAEGHRLFSAAEADVDALPDFVASGDGRMNVVRHDNRFYFFTVGQETGFTYINIVADAAISSQVVRLNFTLVAILAVSIVIALVVSVLLSLHFNNPVRKIVESIRQLNSTIPGSGRMNEFDLIRTNLDRMKSDNEAFHKDLSHKNSLLRSYLYLTKLKNIHMGLREDSDLSSAPPLEGPFLFVLTQVSFKDKFRQEQEGNEERAAYFIKELLSQSMSQTFPDAQTFQPEPDQILTLVFTEDRARVEDELQRVRRMMDSDEAYCFLTIAVSPSYRQASQFTKAYEQALELLQQRPFDDQTRILTEIGETSHVVAIPALLEQEFEVNLLAGNEAEASAAAQRMIGLLERKHATVAQTRRFADYAVQKALRALHSVPLDTRDLQSSYYDHRPWEQLQTFAQLERFLVDLIGDACVLVKRKKEARDSIIGFVTEYVEAHYAGDITLDLVAEKLSITGGYLSTYFKEKTGVNFLDYVNEVRVRKAKALLSDTTMKIQDVAARAGYQNLNSFNRMFKKFTGQTPSEYRRSKAQP